MEKIIRLNKKHVDELTEVDYESEHQNDREHNITEKEMKAEIKKRFTKGHELFFGYRINSELVGYVTLKPFFPGYKHCEVYWLAVKKKYQGHGIGTKLMQFIEAYAKKKGFRKVCVYTGKDMKQTQKFYKKIGYKYINEFKGYFGYSSGNTTAVLYMKEL